MSTLFTSDTMRTITSRCAVLWAGAVLAGASPIAAQGAPDPAASGARVAPMLGAGVLGGAVGILGGMLVGQPAGDGGEVAGIVVLQPLAVTWAVHRANDGRGSFGRTALASYAGMAAVVGVAAATSRNGRDVFSDNPGAILGAIAVQAIVATWVEWASTPRGGENGSRR